MWARMPVVRNARGEWSMDDTVNSRYKHTLGTGGRMLIMSLAFGVLSSGVWSILVCMGRVLPTKGR